MVEFLKEKWKFSIFRFLIKNLHWNAKFWFLSTPVYKNIEYKHVDRTGNKIIKNIKKKFVGYNFNNQLHLDNPGFKMTHDEWEKWKSKKLF